MPTRLTMTKFFFDRPLVQRSVDDMRREQLYRGTNQIKVTAQRSMRYRKSASAPGSPPSAHKEKKRGPLLRDFLFNAWDPATGSAVVGSQLLPGRSPVPVPLLQEQGGTTFVRTVVPRPAGRPLSAAAKAAFRRKVLAGAAQRSKPTYSWHAAKYPARPYMVPAFDKMLPRLPDLFKDALRKVG